MGGCQQKFQFLGKVYQPFPPPPKELLIDPEPSAIAVVAPAVGVLYERLPPDGYFTTALDEATKRPSEVIVPPVCPAISTVPRISL